MKAQVTKTQVGGKFIYTYNNEVVRKSTREFKYACIATFPSGKSKVISLGNKVDSTYNSYARFYEHCELEVVTI